MQDFAIGAPPKIKSRPDGWRSGLRRWARAQRLLNHRRPWLAQVPISGPPSGPNQIAWMESALHVLRTSGLAWGEKLGLLMLISGYVRNETLLSQDLQRGRASLGLDQAQAERRYGRSLAKLIDPDRFPETARLLASGLFEQTRARTSADPTAEPDFTFGLERILDGAEAVIGRRRTDYGAVSG
jgi:hypothetical protein